MGLDSVDVGGAGSAGRPVMPRIQTVDSESNDVISDEAYKGTVIQTVPVEVSPKVQLAVSGALFPGAQVGYPGTHPANDEGTALGPAGEIVLTQDNSVKRFNMHEPVGDVRDGYVTGPRGSRPPEGSKDAIIAELNREIAQVTGTASVQVAAHDEVGAPLIEVLFHLEVGVIASYHTHIVEQDKWLVFVDDNRQAAHQKFIPRPTADAQRRLRVTITGKDLKSYDRWILPLGINFTLGFHDIFVTMIVDAPETAQEA